jgi:hypothetical protein
MRVPPSELPNLIKTFAETGEGPKDETAKLTQTMIKAGIDPSGPEGQRLYLALAKKIAEHPEPTRVDVSVKTGESLAKEIGPMMAESRASALGAIETVDTVGRIATAIDKGIVTLGPTATLRNKIDQVALLMGVAGNTTEERLVNTRQVIRGMAQFAVTARKALKGQGQVSDFEGKLLIKAEAGEIGDMTLPELKAFLAVTDRLARRQYRQHQENVNKMKKRKDMSELAEFYEVPDLPAGGPWEKYKK